MHRGLASQSLHAPSDEHDIASTRLLGSEDVSPRKLKHIHGNNLRDVNGTTSNQPMNGGPTSLPFYNTPSPMAAQSQFSGVAPPPVCRNAQQNGPTMRTYGADNSPRVTVNSAVAGPRRKFVDEGKLRKVSERLFSDSGQRRSMRLAGESVSTNSNPSVVSGNGTSHSKYLGASKSSSVASRSLTIRKGQSWASETADEGIHHDAYDDSRLNITSSSLSPGVDNRTLEPEGATRSSSAAVLSSSRVVDGASDILSLLRLLGEGFRLSCLCRCQDALDIYIKLPQKHYNTGWVLSQRNNEALEMMERAVLADKKNPLPLYQKANILVSVGNLDGALAVLEELKEYAPCESSVYALMGSIYKRQNMYDKAMLHFGLALDLKPSATDVAAIKAAIEKLHVPDEIEDSL
ncbi:UNVERIFIED_CONTAM: Cell division cycle protein 27B [Sesamum radiatum]|uniref:Cell division cycle protein 27B n=1 Tax=Sesamum radiatum TaxID=300843 RepID=A0AAW2PF42_SESRA